MRIYTPCYDNKHVELLSNIFDELITFTTTQKQERQSYASRLAATIRQTLIRTQFSTDAW